MRTNMLTENELRQRENCLLFGFVYFLYSFYCCGKTGYFAVDFFVDEVVGGVDLVFCRQEDIGLIGFAGFVDCG
jgi:hypothetical protein